MRIVFIGAGNLATHLGRALHEAGHEVLQVYSRTMASAAALAGPLGAEPLDDISLVATGADVCIVAVKDAVVASLLPALCRGREQTLFLHTAGSLPMSIFEGCASHYGVLYPMQTFSKQRAVDFSEIPCFVEANDVQALATVQTLAGSISRRVSTLSSDDRRYLHLAAVFACNFANHCYDMAEQVLALRGIDFSCMLPLIDETARKVHQLTPREAQTGPAVRYDANVMAAQLQLLSQQPRLQQLYEQLSKSIHERSHDQL